MEKRIIKKLLAILMVITILATDFFVLGSSLITYAAQINSETNNSNIEFSAYFKNGEQRVDSIEKSIKSEDLKLYAEVKVKNEGYFNGTIEISNSNFNIKKNILSSAIASIEGNKVNLKQINAGEVVEIELGIEPIISNKIAADMLAKTSTIKLTGTYMESTYKGLVIEAEKSVSVNYKVDGEAGAELETDIITNKVFSVNGTNKRIVQLLIKSRLKDNQYPVQQTVLKVAVPGLSGNAPEEIDVLAIGELATNGATKISKDNWTNENGQLQITLNNNADSNNEMSWNKNVYDQLVVTFIYAENVDASKVEIKTDSEIKLHNSDNKYTATYTKGIENQELNNIIMEQSETTTAEIYKGQLYANINAAEKKDVQYNTITTLIVTNTNVVDEIVANEGPDVFGTDESELAANTKYISTEINKEKMLQILGQDGTITIKNGETTIVVNKDSKVNENGNIIINYEKSAAELSITTSKPVNAGILEIKHAKAITENSYTREQLHTVKTLKTKNSVEGILIVDEEKQRIAENSTEAIVHLKETVSKAELTVNRENLSTVVKNEDVVLGIKLITDGVKYDLYKNPKINIQLPSVVESVEFNQKPSKLYADEFEINAKYIPESKVIEINLTGEQTKYPQSSATQLYLQLNLNITVSKLTPTQTDKITMTYTNENASQYDGETTDVGIVEQPIGISAPTGLIKMFNLTSSENTSLTESFIEQITSEDARKTYNFETIVVNNTGVDINNVRILGKVPTTGNAVTNQNKENTLETTLTSIEAPNATIYYTENVNATADVKNAENGWTTNLAELTNAKLYLIKLDSLKSANEYIATVNVKMPDAITKNVTSYTEYQVIYDTDVETNIAESSRSIGLTSSIVAGLETELTAQVGQDVINNGDTVREGEVIKYTAIVKNNGTQNLQNLEIKAYVPEGTVLVQPKEDYVYENGYYDEKEDKEISNLVNLAPGDSHTIQYEVRVKTDITAGTEISNKSTITYDNSTMESNEIKNILAESNVRVTIKRAEDLNNQWLAGTAARYILAVENLSSEKLTDVELKIKSNNINVTSALEIEEQTYITSEEEKVTQFSINEIPANGTITYLILGKINEDAEVADICINVKDSTGATYRSNSLTEILPYTDAKITLSSPQNNAYLSTEDRVEYNIIVENTGSISGMLEISNDISEYLEIQAIYKNKELVLQTTDNTDEKTYQPMISNDMTLDVKVEPGQKAELDIITKVIYVPIEDETRVITNKANVRFNGVLKDESEEIKHTLTSGSTSIEDLKNIISGFAWFDENANGQKDNNEYALGGITVRLYDVSTNSYLVNDEGNVIFTITDNNGEYTFTKIPNGSYIIVFETDMEKYEPTTYLAEGIDTTQNSKAKLQNVLINGEDTTVSGIEINNIQDNVSDMNIGLKERTEIPETPENPDDSKEPENSENPETPDNTENPETPEAQKMITGFAWLDENRNGQKEDGENVLSGIRVRIYNVSEKNYLTDNNGNIVETSTNDNGEYTLNNIEKGEYIILFEYDTEKYEPTTYLVEGVDTTKSSKAVLKQININGEELTLAVTDTINVQDNVSNINIGLKEKLTFDLELNKYISRIVVQNSKETKTYDYENKSFGKVEIHRKQINGSLVVLEYTIKVKNTGEITGYAKNIVDYLPSGLTFSSELNKDWYLSENNLYTKGLENVEIAPGEEKEIKLILTKTMTNENTGLINNRAEIYQDYNKYGENDIDSTPNNQVQNEDDFSSVDVIIGISTGGSTILNIILLLINLVLIGIVIKLMIRNGIIKISTKKERR